MGKTHRYCTMFAYCHEFFETKRIADESTLKAFCRITVRCGNFSFAEIPKTYNAIVGVTGTLKSLSAPELAIIQGKRFNVHLRTYMPSVFGTRVPTECFDPRVEEANSPFLIKPSGAHFDMALCEQINKHRCAGGDETKPRAVLVFFENREMLLEALNCTRMAQLKDSIAVLTETLDPDERTKLINTAANGGKITFATSAFGRGTDFISRDRKVIENGGVHVIQTFLSMSMSDEIQFRGRTGRQGQKGTYSILLPRESLEQFNIKLEALDKIPHPEKYAFVDRFRNKRFESWYKEETAGIEDLVPEHREALRFLTELAEGNVEYLKTFLGAKNKGAITDCQLKIICAIDGTWSMGRSLQLSKVTVDHVFSRVVEILEIQFAVYRNYSSGHIKLLEASPWSSQPGELRQFLEPIGINGGQGNEAIEVALAHANEEAVKARQESSKPQLQVVIIGDAPANTPAEVTSKRAGGFFGNNGWAGSRFERPTTADQEISKLQQNNVKVNAYYVGGGREKPYFEDLARRTGGQAAFLDVYSDAGKEMLTSVLSKTVLDGVDPSGDLAASYSKKYDAAYSA